MSAKSVTIPIRNLVQATEPRRPQYVNELIEQLGLINRKLDALLLQQDLPGQSPQPTQYIGRRLHLIVGTVAEWADIPVRLIFQRDRTDRVATARFLVYWLAHHIADLGNSEIARQLDRDPSAVTHGLQALDNRMSYDQPFKQNVRALEQLMRDRMEAMFL